MIQSDRLLESLPSRPQNHGQQTCALGYVRSIPALNMCLLECEPVSCSEAPLFSLRLASLSLSPSCICDGNSKGSMLLCIWLVAPKQSAFLSAASCSSGTVLVRRVLANTLMPVMHSLYSQSLIAQSLPQFVEGTNPGAGVVSCLCQDFLSFSMPKVFFPPLRFFGFVVVFKRNSQWAKNTILCQSTYLLIFFFLPLKATKL